MSETMTPERFAQLVPPEDRPDPLAERQALLHFFHKLYGDPLE